jgi:quinol monooxygenase YgiN
MRTILSSVENRCQLRSRATLAGVLVVNRFRVDETEAGAFRAALERAHATLTAQRGYVAGHAGRNLDDPTLWALVTTWDSVGSYRRALSSYDVKTDAVPLLGRALDEPSAYEVVEPGAALNVASSRSIG